MQADFLSLPKIELHLHLDCSLSYGVVSQINPAISRADYERDFIVSGKCLDLADYLRRAVQGVALMQSERELQLVTADVFQQLRRDNVLYAEIRFAPLLHTQKGLSAEQVVEIVDDAVARGVRDTGVEARLILCTLRHYSMEQSLHTVHLVERFREKYVTALDIAGDEAGFSVEAHIPAFQYAIANGLNRTAHAGEARGPESVWQTLAHFQPARVGHGIRSIEDKHLVTHLAEKRIHLEICPTSNVQITTLRSYQEHPIARLYDAGVSVGISTDARTISNITLSHEYELLHTVFGWETGHFRVCNLNALDAAFIPDAVKKELTGKLESAYRGF